MPIWKRWLKYGRTYLDTALRRGNEELDVREAELEARAAERPWMKSSGDVPTVDEVRARIENDAAASAAPAGDGEEAGLAFDRAEEQRRADERLERIRRELGLGGDREQ